MAPDGLVRLAALLLENQRLEAQAAEAHETSLAHREQLLLVWAENEELWGRIAAQATQAERARAHQLQLKRQLLERQREMIQLLDEDEKSYRAAH